MFSGVEVALQLSHNWLISFRSSRLQPTVPASDQKERLRFLLGFSEVLPVGFSALSVKRPVPIASNVLAFLTFHDVCMQWFKAAVEDTVACRVWADETSSLGFLQERLEADVCSNQGVVGSDDDDALPTAPSLRHGRQPDPPTTTLPQFRLPQARMWPPRVPAAVRVGRDAAARPKCCSGLSFELGCWGAARARRQAFWQWSWLYYVRVMLSAEPCDLRFLDSLRHVLLQQRRYLTHLPGWLWRLVVVRRVCISKICRQL